MRVAFLYNRSSDDPATAAEDDVPSRSPVVAALRRLGHRVAPIVCSLNLAGVRRRLERWQPDVVFNRVESLGGSDSMMGAVTLLLDALQIPYTGCPTEAMVVAANKLTVKEQLVRAGLPTPEWITADFRLRHPEGTGDCGLPPASANPKSARSLPAAAGNSKFILKSVLEHASFEISDDSIIGPMASDAIAERIRQRTSESGRPFFAERFIEGREFNLSLLGRPSAAGAGPRVLPPAEIDFSAFPAGKPRIVGRWRQMGRRMRLSSTTRRGGTIFRLRRGRSCGG